MNPSIGQDTVHWDNHSLVPPSDLRSFSASSLADAVANPGRVFDHPVTVVAHPGLSHEEKRTILISWARDELVLEQVANEALAELEPQSRIDAVIEALESIDPQAAAAYRAVVTSLRTRRCGSGRHFFKATCA